MLVEVAELCKSLDELAHKAMHSWADDRTLREVFGWNCPALTRHDFARMASDLSSRIKEAEITELDEATAETLSQLPQRLTLVGRETVTHLYNGHGAQAAPAYIQTLENIEHLLRPNLDWNRIADNRLIPAKLHRRLRAIQASLDELAPDKDALSNRMRLINEATEAADSLPTDLESLKRARNTIEKIATGSATTLGRIEESQKQSEELFKAIQARRDEANKLVQQCQEAYRITTTTGLAAAFDQRATSLNRSVWAWVVGLVIALAAGSYIGSQRIDLLNDLIASNRNWGHMLIQALLSVLSIGAPIWLAWLATKQIGQRFRLAEDYGFKASVAKAYEGYRREAARIDKTFEARLFGSALTRLEEAPLRLVEEDSHGSPWHELVGSKAFQNALDKIPALREKFISIAANEESSADKTKETTAVGAREN